MSAFLRLEIFSRLQIKGKEKCELIRQLLKNACGTLEIMVY